jgi:hypothetical protein
MTWGVFIVAGGLLEEKEKEKQRVMRVYIVELDRKRHNTTTQILT